MSEENKNINTEGGESADVTEVCRDAASVKKKPRKVSLSSFIFSAVAIALAAVMLTYTCCNSVYKRKLAEARLENVTLGDFGEFDELEVLRLLFEQYSYYDIDEEKMVDEVLKAYVAATGDRYAEYYTAEEFAALKADTRGESVGIGIKIISNTVLMNGIERDVIEIVGVSPDSPALEAGVKVGDLIIGVGKGEGVKPVYELNYDTAVGMLRGEAGTVADFVILRPHKDSDPEEISFSIVRRKVESVSVQYSVSEADKKVGIVKIDSFDLTVPRQLSAAVDELIRGGCESFVFDVRYNLGGDLESIRAVLSYFLSEGDRLISTVDNTGKEEIEYVGAITHDSEDYASCDVSAEDIGKYAHLKGKMVVLCNQSTASAAELFTAAMRDYGLAQIVGEKTYGKGSMQNTIPLSYFGYSGALKLTTKMYFPPSGEGYDGVGITPDLTVSQSEEALSYSHYVLPQSLDDQLIAAIERLNKSK